jgi:hypothetical protein
MSAPAPGKPTRTKTLSGIEPMSWLKETRRKTGSPDALVADLAVEGCYPDGTELDHIVLDAEAAVELAHWLLATFAPRPERGRAQ